MTVKTLITAAALATVAATAGHAATIDPASFDNIITEGKRTTTVDGADVSGNAGPRNNGDVGMAFDMGVVTNTLLVGRLKGTATSAEVGIDGFAAQNVSGLATVSILNYAISDRDGEAPYGSTFQLLVDGAVRESITLTGATSAVSFMNEMFATVRLYGEELAVRVNSIEGASDYDISVNVAPVPLPAGGLLLLGGLGGAAALRRRKKA